MHFHLIYYWSLFVALTISRANCAASKQLSTVFVLETSDLSSNGETQYTSSEPSEIKERSLDDSGTGTRIITDSGGQLKYNSEDSAANYHNSNSNVHNAQAHNYSESHSKPKPHQVSHTNHDFNDQSQHQQQNHNPNNHNHPHEADRNNQNHSAQVNHSNTHSHGADKHEHNQTHHANSHSDGHHTNSTDKSPNHNSTPSKHGADSSRHVISKNDTHQSAHIATGGHNPATTVRKLDEEAQLVSSHHKVVSAAPAHKNNQHGSSDSSYGQHKSLTRSSTPSSVQDDTNSTPKSEERLLISITSGEDDDYKPPKSTGSSSGSSLNVESDELSSQQHQPHHHHKRKPSITISIQDANLKQNGGAGPSAVIVRPSENGQSIVISTVGAGGLDTKPTIIGTAGSNGSGKPSIAIISNDRDPPYREPVNVPLGTSDSHIHNSGGHHTVTSTRRPPVITSTLIEPPQPAPSPQRPQIQVTDERPVITSSRPTPSPQSNNDESTSYEQSNETNRPTSQANSEPRFPLNEKNCGLVHETRIVGGEEANPDDFMWMAAIIKSRPKDGEARPFCGGSLITRRHILTAAHCLENLAPRDVLVRLGSYDFDDSTASSLSADYAIDQFRVPGSYSKKTHAADIAIMRLKTPLSTTDNYKTVCMPQARRSYVGALGTVTGYGSQSQTFRHAAPKLRQVTVPIWENRKCSAVYKKNLTESFLCAGYEEGGKDACQGDSGGPLMTEGPNERMMIVGVVSHGIGCGGNYPGVYTRTTTFLDWIEKNTRE